MGGILAALGLASKAIETVGSITQGLTTVAVERHRALVDVNKVDKETARDITIESFRTDVRHAELQATLSLADKTDPRSSWMRPYFGAVSAYFITCEVLTHAMPGVAKFIGIAVTPLPFPLDYIIYGIPIAIFGLRSIDKGVRTNSITKTQATIATKPPPILSLPLRRNKREDDA